MMDPLQEVEWVIKDNKLLKQFKILARVLDLSLLS